MSQDAMTYTDLKASRDLEQGMGGQSLTSRQALPVLITRAASRETDRIIRFLVDRDRVLDAYRAYAYFRWVDDWLDQQPIGRPERLTFVQRQRTLMDRCYQGEWPGGLSHEESMLASLIGGDCEPDSGLQAYIRNMMDVMAFDAERRGRLISQAELDGYSRNLSIAVTEALQYFVGHNDASPRNDARYLAATGAHIAHMLRDTLEDLPAGYFNIPSELLGSRGIAAGDTNSNAYREWVKGRVALARDCFKAGRGYLASVENLRCRIAECVYIARFEAVLDAIEKDGYRLRPTYQASRSIRAGLRLSWSVFAPSFQVSL